MLWKNGHSIEDPAFDALRAMGSQAVPCLLKALKAKEPTPLEERLLGDAYAKIWWRLSPVNRQRMPKPLKNRLPHELPSHVRASAALALEGIGGLEGVTSELIAALHEESRRPCGHDSRLFDCALRFLKRSKTASAEIDQLLTALTLERRYEAVVTIIRRLDLKSITAVVTLGSVLESNVLLLRPQALRLLETMGDVAKPLLHALVKALGDSDRDVRYWSLRVLGSLGTDAGAAESHIAARLKDRDAFVREYAAYVLSLCRGETGRAKPVPLEQVQRQEYAERLGWRNLLEPSSTTLSLRNELSPTPPRSSDMTETGRFQTLSFTNFRANVRLENGQ